MRVPALLLQVWCKFVLAEPMEEGPKGPIRAAYSVFVRYETLSIDIDQVDQIASVSGTKSSRVCR